MGLIGSCHCGSVRIILTNEPREVVACDCSLCGRRGMVWAHYREREVQTDGYTEDYLWGDRKAAFHHCPKCGCTTHWSSTGPGSGKLGVNARLLDGFREADEARRYFLGDRPLEVRELHGANG